MTDDGLLVKKLPKIDVVAAVIRRGNTFLIAQRPAHKHKGGCWEFPGGKIESGESNRQALTRELKEEIGITIGSARPFIKVTHQYAEKIVVLDVWLVGSFEGEPAGLEGQPLKWITTREIDDHVFPEADVAILNAIRLPDTYAITRSPSDVGGMGPFIQRFRTLAESDGIDMIQLRAKSLNKDVLIRLVEHCKEIATAQGVRLILNEHVDLVKKYALAGVQLSTRQLSTLTQRPLGRNQWVIASCHSFADVTAAAKLNVDSIVLSPVNKTATHPKAMPLGWSNFAHLTELANVPVYALGGLGREDLATAWRNGAHGVAGIGAFWPAD